MKHLSLRWRFFVVWAGLMSIATVLGSWLLSMVGYPTWVGVLGVGCLFALSYVAASEWVLQRPLQQLLRLIQKADHDNPFQLPPTTSSLRDASPDQTLATKLQDWVDQRLLHDVMVEAAGLWQNPIDSQERIERVLSSVLYRFDLQAAVIFDVELPERRFRMTSVAGVSFMWTQEQTYPMEGSLLGQVFKTQTPQKASSLGTSPDPFLQALVQRMGVQHVWLVPCLADGEAHGVAVYASKGGLSDVTCGVLTRFTHRLTTALVHARQFQTLTHARQRYEHQQSVLSNELQQTNSRLVEKVREVKTVYDLALASAASTKVEDIVQVIISGVKELVGVQTAGFFLFKEGSTLLEPLFPAFELPYAITPTLRTSPEDSPLLRAVLQNGQTQMLNFIETPDLLPAAWRHVDIRSIVAIPLKTETKVEGLFCAVNKSSGLFSTDDVRLISLLTNRLTEVLHRLTLDQELRQRVKDLSVLQEIASNLPSPPVLSDTVQMVGRIIRQALKGTALSIFFLPDHEKQSIQAIGGDWDPSISFDLKALNIAWDEKLPLAQVYHDNQSMRYFAPETHDSLWERDALLRMLPLQELLYFPLHVEHRTIGVLVVGRLGQKGFDPEQRRLLSLIAEQVAVMIERSRLYEKLLSANEKLEQMNHLKNEFISMVSHELRTPLTTIKGFVSIVLNEETGPVNDQQRHFLTTADRAIDRLTLLVSDLLDISRIEAGQIKMQLRPTDLRDILLRLTTTFTPQLKVHSLTLDVNVPAQLPLVMADGHRLMQVIDNLLGNALKFTAHGGITVTAFDKGDYVMVSIKDTGAGIPANEQDRIFDKFYQIKSGTGYPQKGAGLGLSIVRSIVESHHGKVWVDSEVGKGSDFRFIIPRARPEAIEENLLSNLSNPTSPAAS